MFNPRFSSELSICDSHGHRWSVIDGSIYTDSRGNDVFLLQKDQVVCAENNQLISNTIQTGAVLKVMREPSLENAVQEKNFVDLLFPCKIITTEALHWPTHRFSALLIAVTAIELTDCLCAGHLYFPENDQDTFIQLNSLFEFSMTIKASEEMEEKKQRQITSYIQTLFFLLNNTAEAFDIIPKILAEKLLLLLCFSTAPLRALENEEKMAIHQLQSMIRDHMDPPYPFYADKIAHLRQSVQKAHRVFLPRKLNTSLQYSLFGGNSGNGIQESLLATQKIANT